MISWMVVPQYTWNLDEAHVFHVHNTPFVYLVLLIPSEDDIHRNFVHFNDRHENHEEPLP